MPLMTVCKIIGEDLFKDKCAHTRSHCSSKNANLLHQSGISFMCTCTWNPHWKFKYFVYSLNLYGTFPQMLRPRTMPVTDWHPLQLNKCHSFSLHTHGPTYIRIKTNLCDCESKYFLLLLTFVYLFLLALKRYV